MFVRLFFKKKKESIEHFEIKLYFLFLNFNSFMKEIYNEILFSEKENIKYSGINIYFLFVNI